MKTITLSSFILLFAAQQITIAAESSTRKPAYPVFGILQTDPQQKGSDTAFQGKDAFAALCQYQMIYTSDGAALRKVREGRKTAGCNPPVIVYMGGFTTNPGGATEIEKGHRKAVSMIDVAALASAMDATSTLVKVNIAKGGEFAFAASTADLTDENDKSKYCFWIRVDDELMKVLEADAKASTLRVQRGFESPASLHRQGATIFTPVYLGNRQQLNAFRHSNSWPGGPDYLRYALDPATSAAQEYKAQIIAQLMKDGYDGAWLDTFQPVPYNLCDALGRKVTYYWDFHTQQRYEFNSYLNALQIFLRGVHQKVKATTGKDPIIAANSVSGSYALGSKKLFGTTAQPDLLNGGYCFEDSYISPEGLGGKGSKLKASFKPVKQEHWLRNLENQSDAARSGLQALCMMGPAGYVAAHINPSLENYEQLLRFSWCSFLLTVTKERTTCFGLPLLITKRDGHAGFLPLSEIHYAPIGDPLDANDISKLKQANNPCYVRKFVSGLVVVNPSVAGNPALVGIPNGYVDWESKQPVNQLKLSPGDAKLLLKK